METLQHEDCESVASIVVQASSEFWRCALQESRIMASNTAMTDCKRTGILPGYDSMNRASGIVLHFFPPCGRATSRCSFCCSIPAPPYLAPELSFPHNNDTPSSLPMRFEWCCTPHAERFHFQRSSSPACSTLDTKLVVADTILVLETDLLDGTYYWRFSAVDEMDTSRFLCVRGFATPARTESEKKTRTSPLRMMQNFPNPCARTTTITYSSESHLPIRFRVCSILGRLIHEEHLDSDSHTGKPTVASKIFRTEVSSTASPFVFHASELANGLHIYQLPQGAARVERILVKSTSHDDAVQECFGSRIQVSFVKDTIV